MTDSSSRFLTKLNQEASCRVRRTHPYIMGVSFPCWICVHRHTHDTEDTLTYLAPIARYPRRGFDLDVINVYTLSVSHDFRVGSPL